MAKNTSLVPTRVDRAAKKTSSISTVRAKAEKMPHDVTISAVQAVEIQGFILEITDFHISIRHKRGHGSSKQIVSTFPLNAVIERVGVAGEAGQILVMTHAPVRTLSGQYISIKGNTITATDALNGEVTTLTSNVEGVTVSLQVDETAAAKKYGYEAGSAKKTKSVKSDKPAKGKKSKKSDEGF